MKDGSKKPVRLDKYQVNVLRLNKNNKKNEFLYEQCKREDGSYYVVSANKASSVTL